MYFFSTPYLLKNFKPRQSCWEINTHKKNIYITFDDGPVPEVTPWVLDTLQHYDAKASFFCLGKNVEMHSDIFKRIIAEGHSVGNHTFNHLNGWKTHTKTYIDDVAQCAKLFPSTLFRAPYGKVKPSQYRQLIKNYTFIMWSVASGDFDVSLDKEKSLEAVLKYSYPGAIILFHDSIKAKEKLQYVLPRFLEHFHEKGFAFKPIVLSEQ